MISEKRHLSDESKEQMAATKQKKLQSKYNWDFDEDLYDVDLNLSSSSQRGKKFITLREFKSYIDSGKSLRDLKKDGISKHLIQFFSAFCQNKINITKEEFLKKYDEGLSLFDICDKYSIPRDHIGFLRQLYEKKKMGATYINRKKTEVSLTQRQKDIIYGSMMGDAGRMSNSSIKFKHSVSQKDYLLWKYDELKNVVSPCSLKSEKTIDKRSEYENEMWRFYTFANSDIEYCLSLFYDSGKKEIDDRILNNLSPLSIAVWFQDDGFCDFHHRSIIKKGYNFSPTFIFCTDSFSKESCENIQKWFYNNYQISTSLSERVLSDRTGYRIRIEKESIDVFINLIKPHILPMFLYKIDYNSYCEKREDAPPIINQGDIFKFPIGADFSNLPMEEQDTIISDIVSYHHNRGVEDLLWVNQDKKLSIDLVDRNNAENLIKEDYISFSNLGNKFLMSYFPNFFTAKAKGGLSPSDVFYNKEYLSDILRKIIYQGYSPSSNKILKSLSRYRGNKKVSGFMPCVAKAIYSKYCDENSKVVDFCAGYGGRLFGAWACDKVVSYTGIEINIETCHGLMNLNHDLRIFGEKIKDIIILNQDSIIGMSQFRDKYFDFCFTSPPYFDAEIYSSDSGQSSNSYTKYSSWFEDYLIASIHEAMRVSKKVAINIANTGGYMIADDVERWLNSNSINYSKDRIRLPNFGGDHKYESIFVFS